MGSKRPPIQDDAAAATLSFQRRTHALKANFLMRHRHTPLGITIATWDRTEAQTREALHSHILVWHRRRKMTDPGYTPRPAIPLRTGVEDATAAAHKAEACMNAEDDVTQHGNLWYGPRLNSILSTSPGKDIHLVSTPIHGHVFKCSSRQGREFNLSGVQSLMSIIAQRLRECWPNWSDQI